MFHSKPGTHFWLANSSDVICSPSILSLSLQLLFWFLVLLSSTLTLAPSLFIHLMKNAELVFSHFHHVPGIGPGDDQFLRSLTYCAHSKELIFIFHRKVLLSQLPCFCLECMVFLLKNSAPSLLIFSPSHPWFCLSSLGLGPCYWNHSSCVVSNIMSTLWHILL